MREVLIGVGVALALALWAAVVVVLLDRTRPPTAAQHQMDRVVPTP
jgi:hypothetical protein